jgi:hypothetical protein
MKNVAPTNLTELPPERVVIFKVLNLHFDGIEVLAQIRAARVNFELLVHLHEQQPLRLV